ncbi:MAG: TraR/DksA family transcriptional regulator [Nitrospinae bacterium]|jgi:DnaK suppressor protein|nr:TraR/DksA family transcriptional regulator [Nitrospinota bacterium]
MENNFIGLKKILLKRRAKLMSALKKRKYEKRDIRHGDDMDQAESAYEQEMSYIFGGRESEEIKAINEALDRIDKGTYGICENCDEMIGMKRLEAMPFVKYCVNCQEDIERKKEIETVLTSSWDEDNNGGS